MNTTSCILGAHSLSFTFKVNDAAALFGAMKATADRGGTLFEIPFALCELPWKTVALTAAQAGITEIAICHFFPGDESLGDPLNDDTGKVQLAVDTFTAIIAAIEILRENGMLVRFVDGPSIFVLGKAYDGMTWHVAKVRAVAFLRKVSEMFEEADLILALEPLREHEDKVVASTELMTEIIEMSECENIKLHFDVYHADENGEDPARSILDFGKYIGYLHLHGNDRRAPGSEGEGQEWSAIMEAVSQIDSGIDNIPVVCEPFSAATIAACPALGEGLPVPPELPEYLDIAYATLRDAGLPPPMVVKAE